MKTETIRDASFNILGYVKTDDAGNKTIQDSQFNIKGYYNAQQRVTQDSQFRIVANGDQSGILLASR